MGGNQNGSELLTLGKIRHRNLKPTRTGPIVVSVILLVADFTSSVVLRMGRMKE
jgi:hypothetical protein